MSHILSSCNHPRARNVIIPFGDSVGWAAHQTDFYVACNSDSEILTALQTVETVVRTRRHRIDADKFPMFSVGWTWHGFCGDLDPCWFEQWAVTMM